MKSRRVCREAALQALYMCDSLSDHSDATISYFFEHFWRSIGTDGETIEIANLDDEAESFCRDLVGGVAHHIEFLDTRIGLASTHWSVQRMARIDRNILRLGTFELAFRDDIPRKVCLNEAIELAKRFGTDDSPMFVNGVLDKIATVLEQSPEVVTDENNRIIKKRTVYA